MKQFGLAMAGCEGGLEKWITETIRIRSASGHQHFQYMEIGVAWADTMQSMTEIIRDNCQMRGMQWSVVGVDHPDKWCLGKQRFLDRFSSVCPAIVEDSLARVYPQRNAALVILHPSIEVLSCWARHWPIDFLLVDGCHKAETVETEFVMAQPLIHPGGIMTFHDAAPEDQVEDREHDPVQVYRALGRSGLLNVDNDTWELVEWLRGEKDRGGNSCAVFRRRL